MLYSGIVSRFNPAPLQEQPVQGTSVLPQAPQGKPKIELVPQEQDVVVKTTGIPTIPSENLKNADLSIFITPIGASIKECKMVAYDTILSQTNMGLLPEWQDARFSSNFITNGLSMSYVDKQREIEVIKEYKFTDAKYIIEMNVKFINRSVSKSYVQYTLNVGSMTEEAITSKPLDQRYLECSVGLPDTVVRGNFLRFNPRAVKGAVEWVGIRDRYFCVIMRPLQDETGFTRSKTKEATSYLLQAPQFELLPGETVQHAYLMYLGPQKIEFIEPLGAGTENVVSFGKLDFLSQIILSVLRFLHRVTKNWGLSIILFSFLAFLAMSPLSIKSFKSMKRMQELQPLVEELRVKYKDNPQKMNKEVMELYREKKINPLSGCLPLFLQMPIFIALYQTLMRFIDLKGASFLWIRDLSEPDRLRVFANSFPIIGNELNLLPLIMIATMLLQQKLTSVKQPKSSATSQQQKMMSLFMAVFFGIIFYHMPSGLVLYWSINSIVMLIFQVKVIGRVGAKT